ncbi:uncharacterized protein ColSpa_00648 [Colletotrichum spaethianum]|uniref:Reverse transcriptase domain-containing protein n=1 Tax=Colletotrichum spaethianum TaxID=700344 RepID=A0AA37L9Y5_9PEZI|nr:uncharacterized protein ColSpa_00648 [Colletotrichum spaethianum]GKT40467.1 hypothetical protein ColSpa_00648 [Colletotrichum spaethianum]
MSHSTSILSKTLQSITVTKIRELEKQRAQYENRKSKILEDAECHTDQGERIGCLLHGVKELCRNGYDEENDVDNIESLLAQSKYDASVPAHMLQSSEDFLRSKLDVQSHKLSMAHLYSNLVTEWMNPGEPMESTAATALAEEESSFEFIDRQKERLQNLCDQFENVVFTPLDTDEVEINKYLNGFFDTDDKKEVLRTVRYHMRSKSEAMLVTARPFDERTLKQCIKGLLEQDLLSDEKQGLLKEFEHNEVVLREIADVLNTRFTNFETWDWDAGEEGVPVLPRQQLNGKYRIWMDEDVLQAIFVHYVGINSCVSLKEILTRIVSNESNKFWRWHAGPPFTEREAQRRAYYLNEGIEDVPGCRRRVSERKWENDRPRSRGASLDAPVRIRTFGNIAERRRKDYVDNFCVAALPSRVDTLNNGLYADEGEQSEDVDDGWGVKRDTREEGAKTSNQNIKQVLLRTLATEILIQQSLHGQAAVVQSDLKWFGASLSHTSIFAVMRFFGFPVKLIDFYRKVLEAPLNLSPSSDSLSANRPRIRRRGMPMARAPEKLIGELILFVMDFVVNQETGLQLYRLHDDLWVVGDPVYTAKAWAAMQRFARVMGLEFNTKKTGSVYLTNNGLPKDEAIAAELPDGCVSVGHLLLDPESGKWIIDQENVVEHITQLKRQLAESRSVLDWVRTWNSCISRFFGHTFGEPAFCFGKEHAKSILETYQKMQHDIFEPWCDSAGEMSGRYNAVQYIKSKIEERFGVADVSDAFLLFPDQLGGLGLRNPFIPFLMTQDSLNREHGSPIEIIDDFFEKELEDYRFKKKEFEALSGAKEREHRAERRFGHFDPADVLRPGEADNFMSFEEYTAHRELTSAHVAEAYCTLQDTPAMTQPRTDWEVDKTLEKLNLRPASMLTEVEWVTQMYHKEAKQRFGGLRLVEERFLPLGVIAMMAKKAVRWGLIL